MPAPLSRRLLLVGGLSTATLLSACSSDDAVAGDASDTREVETSTGTVVVPVHPTRVVAATAWSVTTLTDLGMTPVGTFEGAEDVVLGEHHDAIASVANVSGSDGYSNDVEKIAALDPDVLITFANSPTFAQEQEITATIGQDSTGQGWEQLCAQVADAVNRSADLAVLKADYETRLEDVSTRYSDVLGSRTWYVVATGGNGSAVLYAPQNTSAGVILTALGATLGPAETDSTYGDDNSAGLEISGELLSDLADGDAIILWDNGSSPTAEAEELFAQPLWPTLPAVVAGNVLRTSMPSSYGQASAFLDGLEALLDGLRAG